MSASQYAVFRFDVKTKVTAGDAPLIFGSLADAELYCREAAASTPALGCRIFAQQGRIAATISDEQTHSRHHGEPAVGEAPYQYARRYVQIINHTML